MFRLIGMAVIMACSLPAADTLNSTPCWFQDAAWAGDTVWLLCDQGAVLSSNDNGATWLEVALPGPAVKYRSLLFPDRNRGFVVGERGTLLATWDGGKSWAMVTVPSQENLRDIHFVSETGWIAGYGGTILKTEDGGKTWTKLQTGITQSLDGVFFANADVGCAVGWNGAIIRTEDGGKIWSQASAPEAMWSLSAVYFRDAQNGWAVGMFGQILRTTDGGKTWKSLESPVKGWLTAILFDQTGRGWITAENDLLVSEDGGQKWRALGHSEPLFLERLANVGETIWAIGPFGVLEQEGSELVWRMVEFDSTAS